MEPNRKDLGKTLRNVLLPFIGVIFVVMVIWMMLGNSGKKDTTPYSDYLAYFQNNEIESFTLDLNSSKLTATLRESAWSKMEGAAEKKGKFTYSVPNVNIFLEDVREIVDTYNTDDDPDNNVTFNYLPVKEVSWIVSLLPTLLIIAVFIGMWVMMRRSMNSLDGGKMMGFGKARVKMMADEKSPFHRKQSQTMIHRIRKALRRYV